jgi:hypothetical protein
VSYALFIEEIPIALNALDILLVIFDILKKQSAIPSVIFGGHFCRFLTIFDIVVYGKIIKNNIALCRLPAYRNTQFTLQSGSFNIVFGTCPFFVWIFLSSKLDSLNPRCIWKNVCGRQH